ncbi:hypothetical protein BASA61_007983 [Batrachochytrium salamandrivorans]|nr:hypothetical protein BASA61_007983 [Batrachochytrium salamandrivorans]KAH9247548.1 hypothetical protein BASA81_014843 [Batrachochytrium salamandrivorans]KAH9275234.1 hypothetical protein BASA83_002469 [Batrachochytrium salamandrivorans]
MEGRSIRRNLWSYPTLSWVLPLLRAGARSPLQQQDLGSVDTHQLSQTISLEFSSFQTQFRKHTEDPVAHREPCLIFYLFYQYASCLIMMAVLKFISMTIILVMPYVAIPQVLGFIQNPDDPTLFIHSGVGISFTFFALLTVLALSNSTYRSLETDMEVQMTALLTSAVYEKALRLSPNSRQVFSQGQIITMVNVDVRSLAMFMSKTFNLMWSVPLHISISIVLLSQLLGRAIWAAGGIYILFTLLQVGLGVVISKAISTYLSTFDHRIAVTREFLTGIKVIKYGALEDHFKLRIHSWRDLQTNALLIYSVSMAIITSLLQIQEVFVPTVSLSVYALLGGDMRSYVPFSALGIFNMFLKPMNDLPIIFSKFAQARISYYRMAPYLVAPEIEPSEIAQNHDIGASRNNISIDLCESSFSWESSNTQSSVPKSPEKKKLFKESNQQETKMALPQNMFQISPTSLQISQGSLVAIIGAVGSGKSSFLSALIGDMRKTSGSANIYGKISYCSQDPWIATGTIEENIVFNNESARNNVTAAITASCLDDDLETMPYGLGTQIGARGVNLSGGQRARVALARALAQDSDIYLLDDPISALDARVSKKVFQDAICGSLKDKTVLLVTHQLHLLPKVDSIIVLDKGRVIETGTYTSLMETPGSELAKMMKGYHFEPPSANGEEADDEKDTSKKKDLDTPYTPEDVLSEERKLGRISFSTFKSYIKSSGGMPYVISLSTIIVLTTAGSTILTLFLGWWSDDTLSLSTDTYIKLYLLIGGLTALTSVCLSSLMMTAGKWASVVIHRSAIEGLVYAPMSFFDTQPVGRMLSRLSGDLEMVDLTMPGSLLVVVDFAVYVAASVFVISASSYIVLAQFVVIGVILVVLYRYFQTTYRELQRLYALSRSPMNAHVSETLTGLPTIYAYRLQEPFMEKQRVNMDALSVSKLCLEGATVWFALCLELLSASIAFVLVLLTTLHVAGSNSAALGVSLVASIGLSDSLNMMTTSLGKTEAMFNTVERLDHYAHELKAEAARDLPTDPKDKTWPTNGAITMKNLTIAYESRPDQPVIKGINVSFLPGEKVGVVGRTGSGKSTLMAALFRIMEASGGSIEIDGIDIATLGLCALRSNLQIIPQEPVLFSGTVRSNIDIRSQYTDDEIWASLEATGLKDYISSLNGKLESGVSEGGSNMSAGQRQLMCLCKAILANPRVLIMDEATAAVDSVADRRIQASIETQFKHTTVLSIAHRLNTIAAFDRVLVLDAGVVVEFDAPHVLLQQEGSIFAELVDATGLSNGIMIRQIASKHYNETATI